VRTSFRTKQEKQKKKQTKLKNFYFYVCLDTFPHYGTPYPYFHSFILLGFVCYLFIIVKSFLSESFRYNI